MATRAFGWTRRQLFGRMAGAALVGVVTGCDRGPFGSFAGAGTTGASGMKSSGPALAGVIVQAGDSIGLGETAGYYAAFDHLDLGPDVVVKNVSVNGRTMQTGFEQANLELFRLYDPDVACVLLIEQGTNDLALDKRSADDLYMTVAVPFVAAAHAAGFYVALGTLLPRADPLWTRAMEKQRLAYNKLVRANSAEADAVNDLAAEPVMGDGVDPGASSYYVDALHPSAAGQRRLQPIDAATLKPLLQRPPKAASTV